MMEELVKRGPNLFKALRLNEEKIRIVLNKADMIDTDQMMRVHGSLMWSLGRVFETPEVVRVYIRGVPMIMSH